MGGVAIPMGGVETELVPTGSLDMGNSSEQFRLFVRQSWATRHNCEPVTSFW